MGQSFEIEQTKKNFGDINNTLDLNDINKLKNSGRSPAPPPMGLMSSYGNISNMSFENMTKSQRPVNVWDLMTLHDVKKYKDVCKNTIELLNCEQE